MTNKEENECCTPSIYDLEDQINRCWTTKEDVSLIRKNVDHLLKEGVLEESLLGLEILIDLRFEKMMNVFEDIVHTQVLVKREAMEIANNRTEEDLKEMVEKMGKYEEDSVEIYFDSKMKKPRKVVVELPSVVEDAKKEIDLESITYRHGCAEDK